MRFYAVFKQQGKMSADVRCVSWPVGIGIAKYFDVPIDHPINEDDTPIIPQANKKRSVFKSVSSLSQRWVSLRRGSEISLEMQ